MKGLSFSPNKPFRQISVLVALVLLLLLVIAHSLSVGELNISVFDLPSILFSDGKSTEFIILQKIRLPRIVLGIGVGGALCLAGLILQGIYRNPLVEPYTLGVSGGASLGVSFSIVAALHTRFGNYVLPLAGFVGALLTVLLVYALSLRQGRLTVHKMVLIGVMVSFVCSSLIMLLMATTTTENLQGIIFWIMGSLDETDPGIINTVVATSLAGLILSLLFVKPLNALRLGEAEARHLGINTDVSIKLLFVLASVLTGVSVASAGIIGFVGLVIPQLLRWLAGSDFRFLVPASFISGGAFLVFCDTIARTIISPNELPIGVITGLLGGTAFVAVLLRKESKTSPAR